MKSSYECSRRRLLRMGLALAGGSWVSCGRESQPPSAPAAESVPSPVAIDPSRARVAIARCRSYGEELYASLRTLLDQLGGIGSRVKGKTVTIKVNLTGTAFRDLWGKTPGETYVTHDAAVAALCSLFFQEGAARVRVVESAPSPQTLEEFAGDAMGWDVPGVLNTGRVEFENTRNRGTGKDYCTLKNAAGGYLFDKFLLNHSYEDTDFFVSLAKMKNHEAAGVTLSLKNLFGITPNSVYGDDAGSEESCQGRGSRMHSSNIAYGGNPSFGEKSVFTDKDQNDRIPMIVADVAGSRPVDLAVVDGITTIKGGEGPWCWNVEFVTPGVLIAGLNPVSVDAVAAAVMGYADPRAEHYTEAPFGRCMNHLLLAERAGVGTADLSKIEVRGLAVEEAKYAFGDPRDFSRPRRRRRGEGRSPGQ